MPAVGVVAEGLNMPRMFVYFPAAMAATVSLRVKLYWTGSHMLLCPLQYHMSPKVTWASLAAVAFVQPVHFAVIV